MPKRAIADLEKFFMDLENGGGGRVKAITRAASAVKNSIF